MSRRARAASALAGAALLAGASPPHAAAGTFRLSQCATLDGGVPAARAVQADLWRVEGGWMSEDCGSWGGRMRFDTSNHRLPVYGTLVTRFAVPPGLPRTSLSGVWLDWSAMPQGPSQAPAYLTALTGPTRLFETPSGASGAGRRDLPVGARDLRFEVWCSPLNGPGWCAWPGHAMELRGFTAELEESEDPEATVGGVLVAGGPHRGVEPLTVDARDGDSGVRRIAVRLGGLPVGEADLGAACRDDRLPPCPSAVRRTVDVDTTAVPDGPQRLRVTVTDAAGNTATIDGGLVTLANRPPAPAPAPPPAAPGGTVPVAAPGAPAPVAGPAVPPAPASPPAGASGPEAGHGRAVARVLAWLEVARRRRTSVAVPAGGRVRIRGRLVDAGGRGLPHRPLALEERRGGRLWEITSVRTDAAGRFGVLTRRGPTRTLRLTYVPRSGPLARSPRLRVTVRR